MKNNLRWALVVLGLGLVGLFGLIWGIRRILPPTLADLWAGQAVFVVDVANSGLPMGESETHILPDGQWVSYVHASDRSAGIVDQCGQPVPFPGCIVTYHSTDAGQQFSKPNPPACLFACQQCPCNSQYDHIDQQQYPRLAESGAQAALVYEYRAMTMLRQATNGVWRNPEHVPLTGTWGFDFAGCDAVYRIGAHPFAVETPYDCLAGGPPGLYIWQGQIYIFLGAGKNPAALGCFTVPLGQPTALFKPCQNNPILRGSASYGDPNLKGAAANPYFAFRTLTSAEVVRVGDYFYLFYEGVRGPAAGDPGDTQFGLGLARSPINTIDGAWQAWSGNPLLVDLPGNIGLGHADIVESKGVTYLYTSLDGIQRSRLVLKWR